MILYTWTKKTYQDGLIEIELKHTRRYLDARHTGSFNYIRLVRRFQKDKTMILLHIEESKQTNSSSKTF